MEDKIFDVVMITTGDAGLIEIQREDLFIVWSCYILGNRKYLVGAKDSDRYFEVTYNVNKQEWYIDIYKKTYNFLIKDENLNKN